jgi:thiol-disulfide isomerase/thioredoxin
MSSLHHCAFSLINACLAAREIMNVFPTPLRIFSHEYSCIRRVGREDIFWASWCSPCNDEAAFLQKSWPGLKAQGIVFIGVDGQEKTSDALKFLQKYAISYPNVQDTLTSEVASDYGVTGFPETLFIDRAGIVVAKWDSPLDAHGLQLEMAKFMHGG